MNMLNTPYTAEVEGILSKLQENAAMVARINAEIKAFTNSFSDTLIELNTESERLTALLEATCRANIDDFQDVRTKKFIAGSVSFRSVTTLPVPSNSKEVDELIQKLKESGHEACVTLVPAKETISKTELMKLSDQELASLGLSRETKDSFSYKLN